MNTPLIIDETSSSPEVILDATENIFSLKGRSYLEDSSKFYKPIIKWFKNYVKEPNETTIIDVNLEYINSSTTKHLVRIFMNLEDIIINGKKVEIIWKYSHEDELMLQRGYELDNAIDVPFRIKSL